MIACVFVAKMLTVNNLCYRDNTYGSLKSAASDDRRYSKGMKKDDGDLSAVSSVRSSLDCRYDVAEASIPEAAEICEGKKLDSIMQKLNVIMKAKADHLKGSSKMRQLNGRPTSNGSTVSEPIHKALFVLEEIHRTEKAYVDHLLDLK